LRRAARTHKLLRLAAAARGGKVEAGQRPARCDGCVQLQVKCGAGRERETERKRDRRGQVACRKRVGRQDATALQKLRSRQEGRRSTVDCGPSPLAARLPTSRLVDWATFWTFSMLDLSKSGVGTECARRLGRVPIEPIRSIFNCCSPDCRLPIGSKPPPPPLPPAHADWMPGPLSWQSPPGRKELGGANAGRRLSGGEQEAARMKETKQQKTKQRER